MKNRRIQVCAATLSLLSILSPSLYSQNHNANPQQYFLNEDKVPNSIEIIPPMPAENSARFEYDHEQYEWGKSLRDTPRGKQAVSDANLGWEPNWADDAFGEAFGSPITKEDNPELFQLVYNMEWDAGDLAVRDVKAHYNRVRPFVYWGESTATPWAQPDLKSNGSYPSGHTCIGWATALVLAEVNPARATEILKRGFEFGQSRVIVGAHYQSDVDAGRILGAGIVAMLHTDKGFLEQLEKAKEEAAMKQQK